MTDPPERRFADALAKARGEWTAADAAACAARAGCELGDGGVMVPLLGARHRVTHPGGEVWAESRAAPRPVHVAVAILLLHYLLGADGAPPAGTWSAYRELPDGLFYAASFARRAEEPLARAFAVSIDALEGFRAAARDLCGDALTLGDASYRFVALPRVEVAVVVWADDDEEPGEARVLFDGHAGHYLPAEDLAGLGGQLAHRLIAGGHG
jgi:hypothetical protein